MSTFERQRLLEATQVDESIKAMHDVVDAWFTPQTDTQEQGQ